MHLASMKLRKNAIFPIHTNFPHLCSTYPPAFLPTSQSAFINNTFVERSPLLSPLTFPLCASVNLHSTLALIYLNAFPRKNNHLNNKQIEQQCCQLTTIVPGVRPFVRLSIRPSSVIVCLCLRVPYVY